ncbi:hypothetical protein NTG1052_170002 [Candidatus Nitrotoga sp. 1052]|nr:hypothetical protein NTG1052_170002 [Candidatus Nitrotoga sp. 1052]
MINTAKVIATNLAIMIDIRLSEEFL